MLEQTTGIRINVTALEDGRAMELRRLQAAEVAVLEEIDQWILENQEFKKQGAGIPDQDLNARIHKKLDGIREQYSRFVEKHPDDVDARLAFASFLSDIGEEEAGVPHLEKARELAPQNSLVWNNLANYYGHRGSVTNAFAHYEKAIALNPSESAYYHNFATTVFLFRKDAREFYGINEQQVFDKAMSLYSNSMRLDPTNFLLAADVAQSYYVIQPIRTNDALVAWTNALNLATEEVDLQGVHVHIARVKMKVGRLDEARRHLDQVSHERHRPTKERLLRLMKERDSGQGGDDHP